ncbi:MAG: hypothetical protein KGH67_01540 [Candidatus Micrarchaeota archaeon]|nr:hypothetical protein [Candidatus Micrarchaeota archaeon]MDE1859189.1 hypothetical protein [Candidatus Micrarchaeota archaeon]
MQIIKPLARILVHGKIHDHLERLREGYNNYGFLLYLGAASAILAGVFGIASATASIIITTGLFYKLGELHREVEILKKEKPNVVP